jgi:ubiquinone/menaquinone biosynthesis C-methylase UbiE
MLAIAREKAASAGIENIAFIEADVERMAEAGPRYDLAMAHSILHLVDDKAALLAALHRALKPGGRLVASTACLGGTMPWLRLLLPVGAFLGLLPRVAFFTVEELETAMEAAGFRVERRWLPGPRKGVFHIAVKPAG